YRLRVFQVDLPLLRERGDDVRVLAEHFLQGFNQEAGTKKHFAKEALERLLSYAWPGNVRELKNVVHSAFILADAEIGPECIVLLTGGDGTSLSKPAQPQNGSSLRAPLGAGDGRSTSRIPSISIPAGTTAAEAERRLVLMTMEYCGGNKN